MPVCYAEISKGRCGIIRRGGVIYADWRDHTKIQKRKKYDAGGDGIGSRRGAADARSLGDGKEHAGQVAADSLPPNAAMSRASSAPSSRAQAASYHCKELFPFPHATLSAARISSVPCPPLSPPPKTCRNRTMERGGKEGYFSVFKKRRILIKHAPKECAWEKKFNGVLRSMTWEYCAPSSPSGLLPHSE